MTAHVTSAAQAARQAARVPEIDGLRAIAILYVLLDHMLIATPELQHVTTGLPRILNTILGHGWLGVDLFFVLSGFLITGILLGSRYKRVGAYFGHFYERRALRILPVYLIVLTLLTLVLFPAKGTSFFFLSLFFGSNFAFILHTPAAHSAGPFWSLAVEEQFYLVWPWLILFLNRRRLAVVLLTILIAEPFVRLLHVDQDVLTWQRSDGLAMGALLAVWFSSGKASRAASNKLALALGAAAVLIAVIPYGRLHIGDLGHTLRVTQAACLFGAVLTFALANPGHWTTAALRSRFAAMTAAFSYCMYLIHVPLIDLYVYVTGIVLPDLAARLGPLGDNLIRGAVVTAATYAIAAFSRRYIELPFLRLKIGRDQPGPMALETPAPAVAVLQSKTQS